MSSGGRTSGDRLTPQKHVVTSSSSASEIRVEYAVKISLYDKHFLRPLVGQPSQTMLTQAAGEKKLEQTTPLLRGVNDLPLLPHTPLQHEIQGAAASVQSLHGQSKTPSREAASGHLSGGNDKAKPNDDVPAVPAAEGNAAQANSSPTTGSRAQKPAVNNPNPTTPLTLLTFREHDFICPVQVKRNQCNPACFHKGVCWEDDCKGCDRIHGRPCLLWIARSTACKGVAEGCTESHDEAWKDILSNLKRRQEMLLRVGVVLESRRWWAR